MSYWKDKRDDLESAYPTCTTFLRFHPEYRDDLMQEIQCDIMFLYAVWSDTSIKRFQFACYALEDSVPWDRFTFDVVNVQGLSAGNPLMADEAWDDCGKAYWIRSGKILQSMGSDWSNEKFDQFTRELLP